MLYLPSFPQKIWGPNKRRIENSVVSAKIVIQNYNMYINQIQLFLKSVITYVTNEKYSCKKCIFSV